MERSKDSTHQHGRLLAGLEPLLRGKLELWLLHSDQGGDAASAAEHWPRLLPAKIALDTRPALADYRSAEALQIMKLEPYLSRGRYCGAGTISSVAPVIDRQRAPAQRGMKTTGPYSRIGCDHNLARHGPAAFCHAEGAVCVTEET